MIIGLTANYEPTVFTLDVCEAGSILPDKEDLELLADLCSKFCIALVEANFLPLEAAARIEKVFLTPDGQAAMLATDNPPKPILSIQLKDMGYRITEGKLETI